MSADGGSLTSGRLKVDIHRSRCATGVRGAGANPARSGGISRGVLGGRRSNCCGRHSVNCACVCPRVQAYGLDAAAGVMRYLEDEAVVSNGGGVSHSADRDISISHSAMPGEASVRTPKACCAQPRRNVGSNGGSGATVGKALGMLSDARAALAWRGALATTW